MFRPAATWPELNCKGFGAGRTANTFAEILLSDLALAFAGRTFKNWHDQSLPHHAGGEVVRPLVAGGERGSAQKPSTYGDAYGDQSTDETRNEKATAKGMSRLRTRVSTADNAPMRSNPSNLRYPPAPAVAAGRAVCGPLVIEQTARDPRCDAVRRGRRQFRFAFWPGAECSARRAASFAEPRRSLCEW